MFDSSRSHAGARAGNNRCGRFACRPFVNGFRTNVPGFMAFRSEMSAIVLIAASAGGLDPLRRIVAALPEPCMASIFVVMHVGAQRSMLPSLLTRPGILASFAEDGASIEPGHIYVAPPDQHMLLRPGRIRLSRGPKAHHTRPAADPLFVSAAEAYGSQVVGIVLSGGDGDGAIGLRAIKLHGGLALVQRPEEAASPSMPLAAIALDHPDACLPAARIAEHVAELCLNTHLLASR
jgi:two-component system, chemotaxis family, protein-glutamate methylesterase/glutaminase